MTEAGLRKLAEILRLGRNATFGHLDREGHDVYEIEVNGLHGIHGKELQRLEDNTKLLAIDANMKGNVIITLRFPK